MANVDYQKVGLIPNRAGVQFADACGNAYSVPELERDILALPDAELLDAVNFHALSVSFYLFGHFVITY